MSDDGLIQEYVALLRSQVRWHRDVDDVMSEIEDHLHSAVERLRSSGMEASVAQRTALERFGDPTLVALAFAAAPGGGLAVPTRSSRTSGSFAIASGVLWVVVLAAWWIAGATASPVGEVGGTWSTNVVYVVGVAAVLGAAALTIAAMIGLDRRCGGLGRLGGAGLLVAGAGAVGTLAAWVFTGWGSLMAVGTLLFGIAMFRRDIAPRLPTIAFGGGLTIGAVAWAFLRTTRGAVDLGGLWGSAWVENQAGLTVGVAILAFGLLGLGRWLRSEQPVRSDPSDHAIMA